MPTLADISTADLLVTPEELEEAALASLALDVSSAESDDSRQVALALRDAQALVENDLCRSLLVHPVTEYVHRWSYDGRRGVYLAFLSEWPFVALQAGSAVTVADHGFAVEAARPGSQRATATRAPGGTDALAYYAGYRGRQHTLDGAGDSTDLTALDGLGDLATLPPLLPDDLRRTIEELALLFLNRARGKTLGTGRRVQQVGQGSAVTVEAADPRAEERLLQRVRASYRNTL